MYTGGLLTPERATFDNFLSPNATPWDEPPTRTAPEALHEEEEDSDSFRSTLADQSNFSTSLPTGHSFNNALPTRPPYIVPASTSTPSRALSASPAASFLSSFFSPAPETPKPDDEGQVIAGYTLGSIIGYGSTSIIRRASSSSGAQAAVKIVRRSDLVKAGNAPQARRKLQHEAAIWAILSHEHILPLFSAVHTTYADYFFTLYCPAGSLFDILKRDGNPALPQDDAGMMFRQIVRGMRYLHEVAHYVHRDMKLENVLVDEMGVCKICDFGMSRKIGSVDEENEEEEEQDLNPIFHANSPIHRAQTLNIASNRRHVQLNHVLNRHASSRQHRNSTSTNEPTHVYQPGSLPYAAPELLLPQTSEVLQPHPSQDIWALGVMLYALLTGKLPFQDSFEPRLQMKILNGTYDLPQGIGRGAERILQGCLDRVVPNRWTIAMVDEVAWGVGWGAEGDDATPAVLEEEGQLECEMPPSRSRSHSRPRHIYIPSGPDWQQDDPRSRSSIEAASRRSSSRAKRSLSRAPALIDKSSSSRSVSRSISRHPRGSSPSSSTPTELFTPSSAVSTGPYSAFFDDSALDTSPPASSPIHRGRRQNKFNHSSSRSPSPSVVPTTPLDALLIVSPTDLVEHPDELHLDPESSRGRPTLRSLDTEAHQLYDTDTGKHGVLDFDAWHHLHDVEHETDRAFSSVSLTRTGGVSSSAFVGQADCDGTTSATMVGFSWRQRPGSSPPTAARLHQKHALGNGHKTALEPFLNSSASSSNSSLALRSRSMENGCR